MPKFSDIEQIDVKKGGIKFMEKKWKR